MEENEKQAAPTGENGGKPTEAKPKRDFQGNRPEGSRPEGNRQDGRRRDGNRQRFGRNDAQKRQGQERQGEKRTGNQTFRPKPGETVEDIIRDTEKIEKEISLEISEIKAMQVTLF